MQLRFRSLLVAALLAIIALCLAPESVAVGKEYALYAWNLDPENRPRDPGAAFNEANIDELVGFCKSEGITTLLLSNWDTKKARSLSETHPALMKRLIGEAHGAGIAVEALYTDNEGNKMQAVADYNKDLPEEEQFSAIRLNQETVVFDEEELRRRRERGLPHLLPRDYRKFLQSVERAHDTADDAGVPLYMSISAYWTGDAWGKPLYQRVIDLADGVDIQVVRKRPGAIVRNAGPAYRYARENEKKAWVHMESIDPRAAGLANRNTFYKAGEHAMRKSAAQVVFELAGGVVEEAPIVFHAYKESFGGTGPKASRGAGLDGVGMYDRMAQLAVARVHASLGNREEADAIRQRLLLDKKARGQLVGFLAAQGDFLGATKLRAKAVLGTLKRAVRPGSRKGLHCSGGRCLQAKAEHDLAGGATRSLGGVDLSPTDDLVSPNELVEASWIDEGGGYRFVSNSGKAYRLDAQVRPEILANILSIRGEVGDISGLGFTLDMYRSESEHAMEQLQLYLQVSAETQGELEEGVQVVRSVPVPNHPRWLGAEYGDTLVGQIALDADLALKYLSKGLDPVTAEPMEGVPELLRAVKMCTSESHIRMWLHLGSARLEIHGDKLLPTVEIGIAVRSIRSISENEIADVGEAGECERRIVEVLVQNFDRIAAKVPSWKALEEVYIALAVVQLLGVLGAEMAPPDGTASFTGYSAPDVVDGIAAYSVNPPRSVLFVVGGVDYGLQNEFNMSPSPRNNLIPQLLELASVDSGDPYWRAVASMMTWDLDRALESIEEALEGSGRGWRYWNLLGVTAVCKGLALEEPQGGFAPAILESVLPADSAIPSLGPEERALLRRGQDAFRRGSVAASAFSGSLPAMNLAYLTRRLSEPASERLRAALAAEGAEKMSLHEEAAEEFLFAGNAEEAAKRYYYLAELAPRTVRHQEGLVRSLLDVRWGMRIDGRTPPNILMLPLQNVTRRPEHQWLSRGWTHLVHASTDSGALFAPIPPVAIVEAQAALGLEDEDLFKTGPRVEGLAGLVFPSPDWILTGAYSVLGDGVRLHMTATHRTTHASSDFSITGRLSQLPLLLDTLIDAIGLETVSEMRRSRSSSTWETGFVATPEFAELWSRWQDLRATGNPEQALALLKQEASLGNPEALLLLGSERMEEGDPHGAVRLLEQHSASLQNRADFWRIRGEAATGDGQRREAISLLNKAQRLDGTSCRTAFLLRRLSETSEEALQFNQRLGDIGCGGAWPLLENAMLLGERGELLAANRSLIQILESTYPLSTEELESIEEVHRWLEDLSKEASNFRGSARVSSLSGGPMDDLAPLPKTAEVAAWPSAPLREPRGTPRS
jgi:hypothetical protein